MNTTATGETQLNLARLNAAVMGSGMWLMKSNTAAVQSSWFAGGEVSQSGAGASQQPMGNIPTTVGLRCGMFTGNQFFAHTSTGVLYHIQKVWSPGLNNGLQGQLLLAK
jgi:hypothetical protein